MKLSIITINLNNANELEKTIKSVIYQKFTDFEYLIIDGGSTDDSINVIKRYESKINYWISEPDKGIFNAMNKGVLKAKGEYLLMLNAGDLLNGENVLADIFTHTAYVEDILYTDVILEAKETKIGEKKFSDKIPFSFFWRTSISHQGAFIKKELHDKIGLYDESLKYSSDWKFFVLAFCKHNVNTKHLNMFLAICNCDGLTWNPKHFPAIRKEMKGVLNEHFPAFVADYEDFDKLKDRGNFLINKYNNLKKSAKSILRKHVFNKAKL